MEYNFLVNDDYLELTLKGRFTRSDNKTLNGILNDISNRNFKKVIINLSAVDYIDPAALDVLMMAKEKCKKQTIKLIFHAPKEQLKEMLEVSQFTDLFAT